MTATTSLSQFNGSLFKVLTGKESRGNVDALSREPPKQGRVQEREDREESRMGHPLESNQVSQKERSGQFSPLSYIKER